MSVKQRYHVNPKITHPMLKWVETRFSADAAQCTALLFHKLDVEFQPDDFSIRKKIIKCCPEVYSLLYPG